MKSECTCTTANNPECPLHGYGETPIWQMELDDWGGAPIIHDGTGRNGDPTTARRMFRMDSDHHSIRDVLAILNDLENAKAPKVERPVYANVGHGHVYPRPDGMKARCGGPGICYQCSREKANL